MKKIFGVLVVAALALSLFVVAAKPADAQDVISLWRRVGSYLIPSPSSLTVGSTTQRLSGIYATTANFTNLTVTSCTGCGVGGGGSTSTPWLIDGSVIYPTTSVSNVAVGTTTPSVQYKLGVYTDNGIYGFVHEEGGKAIGSFVSSSGLWFGSITGNASLVLTGNGTLPALTIATSSDITVRTTSTFNGAVYGSGRKLAFNNEVTVGASSSVADFTTLQEALDYVSTTLNGNALIRVDAGTFSLPSSGVCIRYQDTAIVGQGPGITIFNYTSSTGTAIDLCVATSTQRLRLEGFTISQQSNMGTSVGIDMSLMTKSDIINVETIGFYKGINATVSGTHYNEISRHLNQPQSGATSTNYGIYVDDHAIFNKLSNNRYTAASGTTVCAYIGSHSWLLENFECETRAAVGVYIDSDAHDTTLVNPYIEGNNIGIELEAGVEGTTVHGGFVITDFSDPTLNIVDHGSVGTQFIGTRIQYNPVYATIGNPDAVLIGGGLLESPTSTTGLVVTDNDSGINKFIVLNSSSTAASQEYAITGYNSSASGNFSPWRIRGGPGSGFNNSFLAFDVANGTGRTLTEAMQLKVSSATSTISFGTSTLPACLVMGDSDGAGLTYITTLDGVLTASTDPCN